MVLNMAEYGTNISNNDKPEYTLSTRREDSEITNYIISEEDLFACLHG